MKMRKITGYRYVYIENKSIFDKIYDHRQKLRLLLIPLIILTIWVFIEFMFSIGFFTM